MISRFFKNPSRPTLAGEEIIDLTVDSDNDTGRRKASERRASSSKSLPNAGPKQPSKLKEKSDGTGPSTASEKVAKGTKRKRAPATEESEVESRPHTKAAKAARRTHETPSGDKSLNSTTLDDSYAPTSQGDDESDAEVEISMEELQSFRFTQASGSKTDSGNIGPSGKPYTPLEKQESCSVSHRMMIDMLQVSYFKDKYPGIVLLFEVGYKYKSVNFATCGVSNKS